MWKCGMALFMTGCEKTEPEAIGLIWESAGIYLDIGGTSVTRDRGGMHGYMWDNKIPLSLRLR